MKQENTTQTVTAAALIIGDEILSGRTRDKNANHLALLLNQVGIDLEEVRFVPDKTASIVEAVNALRAQYTYVFTSGGIGPTHDDITADAMATAFGVSISHDPRALALLEERYTKDELNEARLRMARIPKGAELIPNAVSKAPGFILENVYVMAGVPDVFQAMLDAVLPTLKVGKKMLMFSVSTALREGDLAAALAELAEKMPDVSFGSYPVFDGKSFSTTLVARSKDEARLEEAASALQNLVQSIHPSR